MKTKSILIAIAVAIAGAAPQAIAQPAWSPGSAWNRDLFWRGAPADIADRIEWLQQRINRGRSEGSLTRSEASRVQTRLDRIRRDTRTMMRRNGGRLTPQQRNTVQRQLDDLSRQIRWTKRNNRFG
jgi:hypothetical protein